MTTEQKVNVKKENRFNDGHKKGYTNRRPQNRMCAMFNAYRGNIDIDDLDEEYDED